MTNEKMSLSELKKKKKVGSWIVEVRKKDEKKKDNKQRLLGVK